MNKPVKVLAVLSLLALSQVLQSADVQASTVPISESSYVQITNYSGWYLYTNFEDPYGPPIEWEWNGFSPTYAQYYKSIPAIETKIFNSKYPGSPPGSGWDSEQNGLLFDCHSGYANVGDYASAAPIVLCGLEPWTRVEFDWASSISTAAAPNLFVELAGYPAGSYPGDEQVCWRFRPGAGSRRGHAVVDIPRGSIIDTVYIRLTVEPVPEPASIVALSLGLGGLMLQRRRAL